jgi:hypothetical protein
VEGEEGERREKRTPACPSHLHCIQTLYARFGRSVLKADITDAQTGQTLPKYEYSRYRKILGNTGYTSIADTGRFWKIALIVS